MTLPPPLTGSTEEVPVPLGPLTQHLGDIALVVTRFPGTPGIARLVRVSGKLHWEWIWGIFKGRYSRAHKDDEGRWWQPGDWLDLGDGRAVFVEDGRVDTRDAPAS